MRLILLITFDNTSTTPLYYEFLMAIAQIALPNLPAIAELGVLFHSSDLLVHLHLLLLTNC